MNLLKLLQRLKDSNLQVVLEGNDLFLVGDNDYVASDLIEEIRLKREDLVRLLSIEQNFSNIPNVEQMEYYPLSSPQSRIYLWQNTNPEAIAYNLPQFIHLGESVNLERIAMILNTIAARHECFRTRFILVKDEPVQVIDDVVDVKLEMYRGRYFQPQKNFFRPFNLTQSPLFRAAVFEDETGNFTLILDIHHIVTDAVSQKILEKDFKALLAGEKLVPVRMAYRDFSTWQNNIMKASLLISQERFWESKLEQIPILNLPLDFRRPTIQTYEGAVLTFHIDAVTKATIDLLMKEEQVTSISFFISVLAIVLAKLCHQDAFFIGMPVEGRGHPDLSNVVGIFTNTIPIYVNPKKDLSIVDFISFVKHNILEAIDNSDYQFELMVKKFQRYRDVSRNPIFDVMFSFERDHNEDAHDLESGMHYFDDATTKFDLSLFVKERKHEFVISLTYCRNLFRPETIERFSLLFRKVIELLPSCLYSKIGDLDILSSVEKLELLHRWRKSDTFSLSNTNIYDVFQRQAKLTPDRIAIMDGEYQISYSSLYSHAEKIGSYFKQLGLHLNDTVAIYDRKNVKVIFTLFGVLRAGGSFVLIDATEPAGRVHRILEKCKASLFVTNGNITVQPYSGITVGIDKLMDLDQNENSCDGPLPNNEIACILFGSISAEGIKGVLIDNGNLFQLHSDDVNLFKFSENDTWLWSAHQSSAMALSELFGPILCGGKLVILNQLDKESIDYNFESFSERKANEGAFQDFYKTLIEHDVSVLCTDSTTFHNLLTEDAIRRLHKSNYLTLKTVVLNCELADSVRLRDWKRRNPLARLFNIYGPAELTGRATFKEVSLDDIMNNSAELNIVGRPFENRAVLILDERQKLVPDGVPGRLYIRGGTLSRSYCEMPNLTKKNFVVDPYSENGVLFMSPDLGRIRPSGEIEYLGRSNGRAVKINGYEIDCLEIEKIIMETNQVAQCLVVKKGGRLLAYITTSEVFELGKLTSQLLMQIPAFALPSGFIKTSELPKDHFNRVADATLNPILSAEEPEFRHADNDVEQKLVEIWSNVLRIPSKKISVTDNFFEIGGHSLAILKVASLIKREFNVYMPLENLYKTPYIVDIARGVVANRFVINEINFFNSRSNPLIFCLPPYVAYGFCYDGIAKNVHGYCFAAFNYIKTNKGIHYFVDNIIKSQSESPYFLLGFSSGARPLYHVAQELEARGKVVSKVILIDGFWDDLSDRIPADFEPFFQVLRKTIEDLNVDFLKEEIFQRIESYREEFSNSVFLTTPINCDVHLMISEGFDRKESEEAVQLKINHFTSIMEGFTLKKFTVHRAKGLHRNMLDDEALVENSKIIAKILAEGI